jgi:TDG/mug DNA glycosylase family protein
MGLQPEPLEGSRLWALPSPSGLNANHQLSDLIAMLRALRLWVESPAARDR